jgi:hypothetical protein
MVSATLIVSAVASGGSGCGSNDPSCDLESNVNQSVCSSAAGSFTLQIDNPYFPLEVGQTWVLEGIEDGTQLHVQITVLDRTEVVAGVTTRVVEERESEDGELVEVSRNFFAQASDGTVCYLGEDVDIYENGQVVRHDGAWRAGVNGAAAGVFMPADPQVGMVLELEDAPGVAEDRAEIVALGETLQVPAGTFQQTLRTSECTPLEDGSGETKVYAPGVGLIQDAAIRLTGF